MEGRCAAKCASSHRLPPLVLFIVQQVCRMLCTGGWTLQQPPLQHRLLTPPPGVPKPACRQAGTVIAYCSSVLYLTSRMSQITKNHRRRSAEGLALTMFLCAIAANTLYGLSIVMRSYSLDSLRSSLPWLLGSLGTVVLDMTIFAQARPGGGVAQGVAGGTGRGAP